MDGSAPEIEKLRLAYCPPLDDALFYGIASDYDLPRDREILTRVLDSLKTSAIEQEDAEFDPSGTGGSRLINDATGTTRSSPEETVSNGVTSITTGLSDLRWQVSDNLGHDLEDSTSEQKTAWLQRLFPDIPERELTDVLGSHEGSLDKATDELLNLSFLRQEDEVFPAEETPVSKGIEAFAEESQVNRKGRKKRKTRRHDASGASSTRSVMQGPAPNPSNVWATMSDDVDYICSRTGVQPQIVRSVYHANGARLGPTIWALAKKEGTAYDSLTEVDLITELQIAEFQDEFEQVPKSQIYGLLILARHVPSAAYELLKTMTTSTESHSPGKLQVAAQYAPPNLKENEPLSSSTPSPWTTAKLGSSRVTAASYRLAAGQSFEQASAAYRRSKSDRLYGGVAAYHSEIGRERVRTAKALQAAEADSLVARQSSSTMLDLHGVSVQDAVRITATRVHEWWDSLGDAKYTTGGGGPLRAGFRIVTGVGSHSKNHAPKIGPAVSKMLIREGWKVEIGHGELIVKGKNRRSGDLSGKDVR
ncbi:hypothetical protein A1O3_02324 [Capronia epimyces CBS 606.96]|uniref:Smr domain-containing protein n=1 Tax=Capronia epimyces CBS 606.96 TaxID=1182542 RepID=W9Y9Q0_9EURO|nr:uncharacterized protein A1O3_02324 [Capronia epimyces CBS 606.96]EXJ89258.1 hypothetical protein A1O3_02324 [Capronia epimyces CBS 606.96]